ncbi:MAG: helix-turn-helix domain-containing protein [Candidatus Thiodiazotropha sp. (ex Lucinoma aequizonata)]|nr:helix-turn-helix domain-containing protein [Candidatus Thiodiazotropha sp. (ex Lucinoma aequizonata)]MCU7887841.1 helix-turn-helix domain-containing protein [Candidatus Thiodiazotropha sp. (ex Lucinoma aequizonata)]MCU7896951.1 helix-turn-helix domain-containing protein [Candidatus Thiodiazotropha sp. (ex Lucinoma aequizonata)]MCU7899489.1 helix-turn-helix domain-containing protein [Candidatus Thiodiazotropha sp. (ex Lucinoma aequizonata)]MCU7903305.1 helix-turn-helix domain-containing prote
MNYKQLTENERYQIYVMNKAGHSQIEIAQLLYRSASTINRELRRNRGLRDYRPARVIVKSGVYASESLGVLFPAACCEHW